MENKKSFFARLEPMLSPSDLTKVRGAYYMAKYGHRAQVRKEKDINGEPLRYFEHLRRTAIILIDEAKCYKANLTCAALLHDALEDTDDIDANIIEQFFGVEVATTVKRLSKIPKNGYLERLLKSDDATVLVKACDRLDNLRSLGSTNKTFIKKQLKESKTYYWNLFFPRQFRIGREVCNLILEEIKKQESILYGN